MADLKQLEVQTISVELGLSCQTMPPWRAVFERVFSPFGRPRENDPFRPRAKKAVVSDPLGLPREIKHSAVDHNVRQRFVSDPSKSSLRPLRKE